MIGGIILTVIGAFLLLIVIQYQLVDSKMSRDGIKSNAPINSIATKPAAKDPFKEVIMAKATFAVGALGVVLVCLGLYKLGPLQILFEKIAEYVFNAN